VSDLQERPLMTFALLAYNQEQFIREAVEGALAQDYSPLQIILSDDFSPDRTFEKMKEAVAGYTGPHRIVLNRNPTNLGVGEHVNRIVEISEGELIVGAAGDDISMSDRVSETVKAWQKSEHKATSIYSAVEFIDESGNSQGIRSMYREDANSLNRLSEILAGPHGACHAFSRQLMIRFGRVSSDVINEDQVIGFRSALAGSLVYIEAPLVQYRIHGASLCSKQHKSDSIDPEQARTNAYVDAHRVTIYRRQNIRDALAILDRNHPVIATLERQVVEYEFSAAVFGRKLNLWNVLTHAVEAMRRGARKSIIAKVLSKAAIWPIYARYYDYRRRLAISSQQERVRNDS